MMAQSSWICKTETGKKKIHRTKGESETIGLIGLREAISLNCSHRQLTFTSTQNITEGTQKTVAMNRLS